MSTKPPTPVDEPRREKANMTEPQEEFIQDEAVPSHPIARSLQPEQ